MPQPSKRVRKERGGLPRLRGTEPIDRGAREILGAWLARHGVRLLFVVGLALTIRLFFPLATAPEFPEFEVGMVATRDVVAPFSYTVYKDPDALAAEKAEKAAMVFPVVEFIPNVRESTFQRIDRFFTELEDRLAGPASDEASEPSPGNSPAAPDTLLPTPDPHLEWLEQQGLEGKAEELDYLLSAENRARLRRRLEAFIGARLEEGVLTDDSMAALDRELVTVIEGGRERLQRVDRLMSQSAASRRALEEDVDPEAPEIARSVFLDLVTRFLKPNGVFDEDKTRRRIRLAEAEVSPIRDQVLEGEKIIEKGYRVGEEGLERLHALKAEMLAGDAGAGSGNVAFFLGTLLLDAFLLLIFGLYLYFYRRQLYDSIPTIACFAVIFLIVMLSAAGIARVSEHFARVSEVSFALIPIALASLLLAILHDVRISLVATLVLAILIGGQESFGYEVLFVSLMGGISGGLSIRIIRKRRQFGESILYIAAGYILGTLTISLIRLMTVRDTIEACGWGGLNAVASTLFAMALLPLFEFVFNETTDLTLMELSDFNHPLLKSLVIRAPGTWAHTLGVSSLAEAAAEAIGANSLLARVGCYYHDVGKIRRPEYFIENQTSKENPHDRISPKMSVMIISNHVKEGIELAREAKVPQKLIDFIPEHHGTTKISFFFEKAKGSTDDPSLSVHDFSYQGPKPRSRETAICMLADSVESMSRILVEPSPSRIRGMVKTAIWGKVEAEQLEECDLTFRDIHRIEESFVKILLARFHSRIEYLTEEKGEHAERREEPGRNGAHQPVARDRPPHAG